LPKQKYRSKLQSQRWVKTINYCIGGDYRDYSRGIICLKGYEILSFHYLSFYKDFGDEIQNIEGGNVKGQDEYMV
jgi:hypothetical protein